MVSLLINDFKESLSKDGSEPLGDKGTTDEKPEHEDDTIYRLLRGAPTLIVVRSKGEAASYRPRWIHNAMGHVEAIGYEEEPPSPRPLEAIQNTFFSSLVMKNKRNGDEYVPVRLRGGGEDPRGGDDDSDSDSSESPDVVPQNLYHSSR
jgi:hypothetical protein